MAAPDHTASTEHPAQGGHGGFPPFQSHTFASQLVWLAIAFVLLYVLMARLALPRVGAIIESRQKRIADDLAEAARLKSESDAAVAAYEKALADARTRAQAIANETRERQAADFAYIETTLSGLQDPRLNALARTFLADFGDRFRRAAAARGNHHARRGGLVEHTAQMMRSADAICSAYRILNRDLVARIDALGEEMATTSARLFASDEAREAMTAFLSRKR